jgi:hypothetical protein
VKSSFSASFDVCAFFGGQSLAPPMTEPRLRADQELEMDVLMVDGLV